MKTSVKPRVKFCWECGKKLRGNHFKEIYYEGAMRICHKDCAKSLCGNPNPAEACRLILKEIQNA